jgi:AcrR family transcriptional regulator
MAVKKKTVTREDELKTRDRILKAAAEEFVEFGFYGARTRRIADRAKVNKALIHYYYSTKENIYEQVLRRVLFVLLEKLNAIEVEGDDTEKVFRKIIDVYAEIFSEYNSYVKLVIYEVLTGAKVLPGIVMENLHNVPFNPRGGKLYKYFQREMKAGRIRKVNIFQLLISLISQVAPVYFVKPVAENVLGKIGIEKIFINRFVDDRKDFIMQVMKQGLLTDKVKKIPKKHFGGKK